MAESKGLGAIAINLNGEQASIIAAHEHLRNALAAIRYPKSGRWEDRDTAISVLETVAEYVSATFDVEENNFIQMSSHTEVLQDVVLHLRQGKRGTVDRRLAIECAGEAGPAHDDALVQFKSGALKDVEIVSRRLQANGVKAHKAEARREVAQMYQGLGLTFQQSKLKPAENVTPTSLESWEKRQDKSQRRRAD